MPDPASNARDFRDHPAKESDKTWFTDEADKLRQEAERLRVRAAAFADDARVREARAFAEKSSEEARKAAREATVTFDAVLQEASKAHSSLSARVRKSAVETLADQSPETLARVLRSDPSNVCRSEQLPHTACQHLGVDAARWPGSVTDAWSSAAAVLFACLCLKSGARVSPKLRLSLLVPAPFLNLLLALHVIGSSPRLLHQVVVGTYGTVPGGRTRAG